MSINIFTCMNRFVFCFFFITTLNAAASDLKDFEKHFKLLPQPKQVALSNAKGIAPHSLRSIFLTGTFNRPVLYGLLNELPAAAKEGVGVITFNVSNTTNLPNSPEAYILDVKNNRVTITARSEAGLFYGAQTLLQLIEDAADQQIEIPACTITDYPDIAYRAIHLDLKHHLDAGRYYYDVMDRLAKIKINAVIVEFEDKLRYRKAPVVGASHAISIEEFAAISRYAKARNIEISPLVQGLGHASFILKHEQYKKLRDDSASDWSFDAVHPQTYDVQFALYEDALAATPYGKYLHVGGDEVGNLGISERAKGSGLTPMQLQMQWLTRVSEFARKHNRIPIFWDDMLFKLADLYQTTWDSSMSAQQVETAWAENGKRLDENIQLFPKTSVYMRWNYDTPEILGNQKAIDWYKSHNLMVMAATAAQTMWPLLPRERSNFQPIKSFCRITAEKKLDGILCTAWDDCSPHFETYWRGFHNFAFFSWNYKDVPADGVHALFRHRFYGPALRDTAFDFQTQLEKALSFWETALITKGHRNNYHKNFELLALPDERKSGAWSQQHKERLQRAKEEIVRYGAVKNNIRKAVQVAHRNRFSLELLNQINELQIYPAQLLLLLEKYDQATPGEKQKAKEAVAQYVGNFDGIRKNFEAVFSETRLLSNPPDYILDQNHHNHLANGTLNSDWMYMYELPMNARINAWLAAKNF